MSQMPDPTQFPPRDDRNSRAIVMTLIISCAVLLFLCMAGTFIITAIFLMNAPWV
jgi:hypothetical protein